ncbi:hypothetical protein IscW_ISCW015662, partial [Ixodes scapularis]
TIKTKDRHNSPVRARFLNLVREKNPSSTQIPLVSIQGTTFQSKKKFIKKKKIIIIILHLQCAQTSLHERKRKAHKHAPKQKAQMHKTPNQASRTREGNVERERDRTEQHFLDEKAVVLDFLRRLHPDYVGHRLDTSAESAFDSDLRSSHRRREFRPDTNATLASN